MEWIIVAVLSITAGWLVNLAADALPDRKSFATALHKQIEGVRCIAGRNRTGDCLRSYTLRLTMTWVLSVGLGLLAYSRFGFTMEAGVVALYAWYFLAIAVIDIERRRVLNRMLLAALPIVAAIIAFTGIPTFSSALMGAAIGFGVFFVTALVRPGGMGMGDVKLAGLIGLATGVAGVVISLIVGILVGGLAGFVVLVRQRMDRRATMAYAPYLAVGAWIALYFGSDIVSKYLA